MCLLASVWWYQIPEIISDKTQRLRFQYPLYFSSFVVIFVTDPILQSGGSRLLHGSGVWTSPKWNLYGIMLFDRNIWIMEMLIFTVYC